MHFIFTIELFHKMKHVNSQGKPMWVSQKGISLPFSFRDRVDDITQITLAIHGVLGTSMYSRCLFFENIPFNFDYTTVFTEEVSWEAEANEDPAVAKTCSRKSSFHPGVLKGNIKPILSGKGSTELAEVGR